MSVGRVAIPVQAMTLAKKAEQVFGAPKDSGKAEKALEDGKLTLAELKSVYGITSTQLQGLEALNITWADGIDETELNNIVEYRNRAEANFILLFKGTGKSGTELKRVFKKLWQLALKGELTEDSWNAVMAEHGLDDYEMNGDSFSAMLGSKEGKHLTDSDRAESFLEFGNGLNNLVLTMQMHFPPTGSEERDAAREIEFALVLKRYCSARSFNIIRLENWEEGVRAALGGEGEVTLAKVKDGEYGDRLEALAGLVENWNEFLVLMLVVMERAMEKGMDTEGMNTLQFHLSKSKNMKLINEILEAGPKDERFQALMQQLEPVLKGKKPDLDMEGLK